MGQVRSIKIPDHQLNRLAQYLITAIPEYRTCPYRYECPYADDYYPEAGGGVKNNDRFSKEALLCATAE